MQAEVTLLTKKELVIETASTRIIIEGKSVEAQVFRDNQYDIGDCIVNNFKM